MRNAGRMVAVGVALGLLGALAGAVYAHQAASSGIPIATAGTTYALVVGISDFAPCGSGGPDLQFAAADADSFESALTTMYGIPGSRITKLLNCAATKANILDALGRLKKRTRSNDDLIVFVAGHGTFGFGFLLGCSPDAEVIDNAILTHDLQFICDNDLKDLVTADNAARKSIMLDISFPSGFNDDFTTAANTLYIAAARGEARELDYPPSHPCGFTEDGHGVFTCWFVVQGILGGQADNPALNPHANGDGLIPFEEAYDFTFHALQGPLTQKPDIVDNVAADFLPAN